jgi:hypothetical protein
LQQHSSSDGDEEAAAAIGQFILRDSLLHFPKLLQEL